IRSPARVGTFPVSDAELTRLETMLAWLDFRRSFGRKKVDKTQKWENVSRSASGVTWFALDGCVVVGSARIVIPSPLLLC
ncbi:hypothetical protein, partial [Brevibacterium sp. FAM 24630]|uniref:hypothetical protein n=1 Tax=Brevibacterium sp. FAM 24630 TaxID=3415680 RepID=UPI003C7C80FA